MQILVANLEDNMADVREKSCTMLAHFSLGRLRRTVITSVGEKQNQQTPDTGTGSDVPSGGVFQNYLTAASTLPPGGEPSHQQTSAHSVVPSGGEILKQLSERMLFLVNSPKDRRCESGAALAKLITTWRHKVSLVLKDLYLPYFYKVSLELIQYRYQYVLDSLLWIRFVLIRIRIRICIVFPRDVEPEVH